MKNDSLYVSFKRVFSFLVRESDQIPNVIRDQYSRYILLETAGETIGLRIHNTFPNMTLFFVTDPVKGKPPIFRDFFNVRIESGDFYFESRIPMAMPSNTADKYLTAINKVISLLKKELKEESVEEGKSLTSSEVGPVAEVTFGKFYSTDSGMDDTDFAYAELGEKAQYPKGARVEVKYDGKWYKGVVESPFYETERCIVVKCVQKIHNGKNLNGHGLTIWVANNTRRAIMSMIRKIDT